MNILTLTMLSILLSFLLGIAEIINFSNHVDLPLTGCQTILLNAQNKMTQNLNELLKLNPMIKWNHRAIQTTKSLLLVPATAGAASKALIMLKKTEKILSIKQKSIFTKLNASNMNSMNKLNHFFSQKSVYAQLIYSSKMKLKLRKQKLSNTSTLYFPQKNFSDHQKITAIWTNKKIRPLNLNIFSNDKNKYFCSATILQRENLWIASLIRGK